MEGGGITSICCVAKHNVYGQTMGTKVQYVVYGEPYRDNPGDLSKVGVSTERDITSNCQAIRSKRRRVNA